MTAANGISNVARAFGRRDHQAFSSQLRMKLRPTRSASDCRDKARNECRFANPAHGFDCPIYPQTAWQT